MLNKTKKYEIYPGGSCHPLYPCEQYSGTIFFEDGENTYIPRSYSAEWGKSVGMDLLNNDNLFSVPDSIAIAW